MRYLDFSMWIILVLATATAPACTPAPTTAIANPFTRIVLRDVHGLWGGNDLWLYADGRLVVQVVDPSKQDKALQRYETKATAAQITAIEELLHTHNFAALTHPEKPGIPDAGHPTITLESKTAPAHTVAKWDNEKIPDFDPIYQELLKLAKQAQATTPTFEGPYDWNWSPDSK